MVIVYRSNTGFTKEYAEMLGKTEKMKVCPLAEAQGKVGPGESVFYMGPLMAGHIVGLDKAVRQFAITGVCGVGMSPANRQIMDVMARANHFPDAPVFYLQGGWAPKKVGWLKCRMVNMVTRSTRRTLQDKGSRRTPEEDKYLDFLIRGGSFVAFENLAEIRAWLKEA